MGATARPMWQEERPEDRPVTEFGQKLRDAMRLGESTVEELLEAQKRALEAITPLVRPDVWREALKRAGGDRRRIYIFGPEEVHVVNNPGQRPPWLVETIRDKELETDVR